MRNITIKAASWLQARQPSEEGQGVIEYGLVVALVSLVIIGVLATVGETAINGVGKAITAALPK